MDLENAQMVEEWAAAMNLNEIQAVLAVEDFYQMFQSNNSTVIQSLTKLTKKLELSCLGTNQKRTFNKIQV
jgi:hypothetical protein